MKDLSYLSLRVKELKAVPGVGESQRVQCFCQLYVLKNLGNCCRGSFKHVYSVYTIQSTGQTKNKLIARFGLV